MFPHFPIPAIRSHVETLLGFYVDLGQRTLATMQSLSVLNLQLGRDFLAEAGASTQRLMASKDAAQLDSTFAAQLRPGSHALQNYQQRVAEVMSRWHAVVSQATADHMPAVQRSASVLAEDLAQEAAARTSQTAERLASFQTGGQLRH